MIRYIVCCVLCVPHDGFLIVVCRDIKNQIGMNIRMDGRTATFAESLSMCISVVLNTEMGNLFLFCFLLWFRWYRTAPVTRNVVQPRNYMWWMQRIAFSDPQTRISFVYRNGVSYQSSFESVTMITWMSLVRRNAARWCSLQWTFPNDTYD